MVTLLLMSSIVLIKRESQYAASECLASSYIPKDHVVTFKGPHKLYMSPEFARYDLRFVRICKCIIIFT